MLITNRQTQNYNPRPTLTQGDDFKNPFRDRMEAHEYMEVHDRLVRYTDTYDNSEYDSNPARGVTEVMDSSGDASVGSNMRFHGSHAEGTYQETRFNSHQGNSYNVVRLNFTHQGDKVLVTQAADRDGDKYEEFHRETLINPRTMQIESVVER
jgi:hypothetical protein